MVNVYLLIELLGAADAASTVAALNELRIPNCKLANVVALADDKLVAQLDCKSYGDANTAILEKIAPVEGIVQTNILAAVRPIHKQPQ